MFERPVRLRINAISSRFSEAWVWTTKPCACDSAATASSSACEHETAKRGAKAARRRPLARPCHRLAMATLSSSDAFVCSIRRAGAASSASIMHFPTTARSPVDSRASKTASVSCTVSIVSTVVVPLISSSEAACRAAAASDAGVCAASIGHTRVFSQSSSARSSA